jgi:hypothetical protein
MPNGFGGTAERGDSRGGGLREHGTIDAGVFLLNSTTVFGLISAVHFTSNGRRLSLHVSTRKQVSTGYFLPECPPMLSQRGQSFHQEHETKNERRTKTSQRRLQEGKWHPGVSSSLGERFSPEPSASPISHQANTWLEMHDKQRAPTVEASTPWLKPRRAKHHGTNLSQGPMQSKRGEGRRSETRSLQDGEPCYEEGRSEEGEPRDHCSSASGKAGHPDRACTSRQHLAHQQNIAGGAINRRGIGEELLTVFFKSTMLGNLFQQ